MYGKCCVHATKIMYKLLITTMKLYIMNVVSNL